MNINYIARKYEDFKASLRRHSYSQITDNTRLEVDYCKGVPEYNENVISIITAKNKMTIYGTELKMRNYSTDGIIIYGKINEIKFDNIVE